MRSQIACGPKKDAVDYKDANIHTIIRRESGNGLQGAILLQGPRLAQITLIMVKVCKNKKEVFSKGSQMGDCTGCPISQSSLCFCYFLGF